jgi:O-antigen ligase
MSAQPSAASTGRASRADAAAVLAVLLAVLLFIPSRYAVTQIAGFVTPAFVVGLFGALWWACARVAPVLGAAQGRQPVRLAIFFLLWAAVASCLGIVLRLHNDAETRAIETGLFTLISSAGIALLAADGIRNRHRLDWLMRCAVVGTALVAVIVFIQFFLNFDLASLLRPPGLSVVSGGPEQFIQERSLGVRRVAGTAAHPIEMGVVLALMLPLAIHYSRFPGRGRAGLFKAATVLITFAMFLTVSRSTFVAIAAEAVLLVPTWPRRLQLGALAATPAVVVAVRIAAPGVVGTLVGLFVNASTDNSFLHRVNDYSKAADYIAASPFFGRGIHTFIPTQYFYIDNSYLLALLETGVIGALSIVVLFLIGMGVARGARLHSTDPGTRDLGQSLAASIAAAMATTFTYDSFGFPMATGMTFLLIGSAGALWRLSGAAEARRSATVALATAR